MIMRYVMMWWIINNWVRFFFKWKLLLKFSKFAFKKTIKWTSSKRAQKSAKNLQRKVCNGEESKGATITSFNQVKHLFLFCWIAQDTFSYPQGIVLVHAPIQMHMNIKISRYLFSHIPIVRASIKVVNNKHEIPAYSMK